MQIEEVTGFTGGTSGKETHLPMQEAQETWIQPLRREEPPEEEIATRFSSSAWEIPWAKELGGLQSMGHKESDTTEHTQARKSQHSFFKNLLILIRG